MIESLLTDVRDHKNLEKAKWWENYVKHDSHFWGVPMKTLRMSLRTWVMDQDLKDHEKIQCVKDLFHGLYAEEKLLGILLMAEHMQDVPDDQILDLVEVVMDDITDWNICDWLCVKVLMPRVKKGPLIRRLHAWSKADNLWLRRAALVPFANVDHTDFKADIFMIASKLISAPERFSKTAVGWVLREMIQDDRVAVIEFLKKHKEALTLEVLNNVLKHEVDKADLKRDILQK